jgi:hypothetical protein
VPGFKVRDVAGEVLVSELPEPPGRLRTESLAELEVADLQALHELLPTTAAQADRAVARAVGKRLASLRHGGAQASECLIPELKNVGEDLDRQAA